MEVHEPPKAGRQTMTDQTPETTPDTTILDTEHEVTPDPTQAPVTPAEPVSALSADTASTQESTDTAGVAPESDPTQAPADIAESIAVSTVAGASDASGVASTLASEVHKFRLVHEIYDATETVLHSARTSAPIALKDATEILALLAKFGL